MKTVNEIHMGEEFIVVKQRKNGSKVAVLHRNNSFGVLEMERVEGKIRIKDLEVGSAFVDPEHLAVMLREVGMLKTVSNILGEK